MNESTVAQRYAQALYQEVVQENQVERIDEDMALLRETMAGSPELVRFFESPVISREKKAAVVQQLFASRVHPTMLRFLELLIEKNREDLFPTVVRAYSDLRDRELGIVEAGARVAQPLAGAEEQQLREALERLTGKRVRLNIEQDPQLIGGLIVRIGDTVYDGSVNHQLAMLREQLERGTTVAAN